DLNILYKWLYEMATICAANQHDTLAIKLYDMIPKESSLNFQASLGICKIRLSDKDENLPVELLEFTYQGRLAGILESDEYIQEISALNIDDQPTASMVYELA